MNQQDLSTIFPLVLLTTWACALLIVDLFIPKERKGWTALLAAIAAVVLRVIFTVQLNGTLTQKNLTEITAHDCVSEVGRSR